MNNQMAVTKAPINMASNELIRKSLLLIVATLFIILVISLIFLPGKADATTTNTTTTSTSTTIYIPLPGYYYYTDANGNPKPCNIANCGTSYTPNSNGNNNGSYTGSTFNNYQYPIPKYNPYTKTNSIYPSNNYQISAPNSGSADFADTIYPPAIYTPYEKVGNTIKAGKAKIIPVYDFNPNGLLKNSTSNNYGYPIAGTGYGYGYGSTNTGFKQTNTGSTGGFIMTKSGY